MNQTFKPISLDTSIRNRSRFKSFVWILSKFEGMVLTNSLAIEIRKEVFRYRLADPKTARDRLPEIHNKYIQNIEFTDEDLTEIINSYIPGTRKDGSIRDDSGWGAGWPTNFYMQFKLIRALGFVYFVNPEKDNSRAEKIIITPLGKAFLKNFNPEDNLLFPPVYEEERLVFSQVLAKYHANNPFYGNSIPTKPFVLLLKVIQLINNDKTLNPSGKIPTGIRRKELIFILIWTSNDANALFQLIKLLRETHDANVSGEDLMLFVKQNLLFEGSFKSIEGNQLDTFIRTMLISNLFSNFNGRNYSINTTSESLVDYIIKNYSSPEPASVLNNREAYNQYAGQLDEQLASYGVVNTESTSAQLTTQAANFSREEIKKELNLYLTKRDSTHQYFKHIDSPLRLEFLTAILLIKQFPDASVKPNYKVDDFGTPTSCAPAGKPDILCDELGNKYIVEVTTIRSSAQIASEMVPITHHLKDLKNKDSTINCSIIFIAPIIHERSNTYADFIKFEQSIRIENISIEKLIFNFESNVKKLDLMTS